MTRFVILLAMATIAMSVTAFAMSGDEDYAVSFTVESGQSNVNRCSIKCPPGAEPGTPGCHELLLAPQYSCLKPQTCCGIFSCSTGAIKPGTGFACCGSGSTCQESQHPQLGRIVTCTANP